MRAPLAVIAAATLLACGGDDGGTSPLDGRPLADGAVSDALPGDCYQEQAELANDETPEGTGLVVGSVGTTICGVVAIDHSGGAKLDVDRYLVTVVTPVPVTVRLSAPGAAVLERLELELDGPGPGTIRARVVGGLGVAIAQLGPGAHTIAVLPTGLSPAPIPYKIASEPDQPALRCPIGAAAPDYREVDETGAGHRANDMVAVHGAPLASMATASTADHAEDTQRAVSAVGRVVLAGSSADVASDGDDYHDRDTFALYTGQTTNFLEVRAAWAGAADLDVLVFEAEQADDPLGAPVATVSGDLVVTAVKPATLYWIWVGGSTRSAALPAAYQLAVCGRELTPDAP